MSKVPLSRIPASSPKRDWGRRTVINVVSYVKTILVLRIRRRPLHLDSFGCASLLSTNYDIRHEVELRLRYLLPHSTHISNRLEGRCRSAERHTTSRDARCAQKALLSIIVNKEAGHGRHFQPRRNMHSSLLRNQCFLPDLSSENLGELGSTFWLPLRY